MGGCGGGDDSWAASAQSFMNLDAPLVSVTANQNTKSSSFNSGSFRAGQSANKALSRADLFPKPGMLKSLDAVSEEDVVLDVSNSRSPYEAHIRGAVHIPAKSFFYENKTPRSVPKLATILGGPASLAKML